jgi:hypothetical protein
MSAWSWCVLGLMAPIVSQGQTAAAPAAVSAPATAATMRQSLLESIRADLDRLGPDDDRQRASLERLRGQIESLETAGQHAADSLLAIQRMGSLYIGSSAVSEETRKLHAAFLAKAREEAAEAKARVEAAFAEKTRSLLDGMMKATDAAAVKALQEDLRNYAESLAEDSVRGRVNQTKVSQLRATLEDVQRFFTARQAEQWSSIESALSELAGDLDSWREFVPPDGAKAWLEGLRKSSGMLSPDEARRKFDELFDQLLDDANQNRLDEIAATISKYASMASAWDRSGKDGSRWQRLQTLAANFGEAVKRLKDGMPARFSPDAMLRQTQLDWIGRKEWIERLKRYQVELTMPDGGSSKVRLYQEPLEVIERIHSPADLTRELPLLREMQGLREGDRDGALLGDMMPRLEAMERLHRQLESGLAFSIEDAGERYGYAAHRMPSYGSPVALKLQELRRQLDWQLLGRLAPGLPGAGQGDPHEALSRAYQEAVAGKRFADALRFHSLAVGLRPDAPLMSPRDHQALAWYVAGLRQQDELEQPRLATHHLQRAAAIASPMVPAADLKERLQRLRREHASDYQLGTGDALREDVRMVPDGIGIDRFVPARQR